jgi:hypothetical protein
LTIGSSTPFPNTIEPWTHIYATNFVPSQAGSYTLQVTNPSQASGISATASGTFQVYTNGTIVPTPALFAPSFTEGDAGSSTSLLLQVAGISSITGTLTASTQTGGNWLTVGGQLSGNWTAGQALSVSFNPAGLPAGNYSGVITLIANLTGGPGPITVPVNMTVLAPLSILTASNLPIATNGQTYSTTITESGGTGLTWSLVADTLPSGLTLGPNTGIISGVPVVSGGTSLTSFTIGLQDSLGRFTSRVFSMTVDSPPVIGTQPLSQTVIVGATATFSVTASGTPAPSYQWQYLSGSTWTPFTQGTGTTTATMTTNATTTAQSGLQLNVIVSNGVGSPVTSNIVALTVNKITPTVTVTPGASSITTMQALAVTVAVSGGSGNPTASGSVTLTSGSYTSAATTLSGGSATINITAGLLALGSDTFTASYTPDSSSSIIYNSATGTSSAVTVSSVAPTITFTVPNHTYGDAPFTVSATSNSSGAITYSVVSGLATISSSTVTLTGAGTVVLQASQAAAGNYMAGTQTAAFTVAGNAPTISFTVPNHTYGDAPFTVSATSNSTGAVTYSVVSGPATISGSTVTLTGAGTVVLQASQAAAGNYTAGTQTAAFTVAGNAPTISFTVPNHTYGDAPFTVAATSNSSGAITYSVVSGPATISGSTVTLTGAGSVVLQASQVASGNYTAGTQTATVTVAKESQTITFTTLTSPVIYGVSPITLSASASSGLTIVFSVLSGPGTISGSTLTITGAGTVVVAANQAGNSNCAAATQVTQSITVNQATQTIAFTAPTSPVTYGVSPITLVATGGASGNAVVFSVVSGPGTISGNSLTITGAGTVVVAANQAGNSNYAAATQVTQSITVNVIGVVTTPTFSPVAGTYTAAQTVSISDVASGATIYYTTNGTTPTTSSTVYTSAIPVSSTETLQAIATATGYSTSAVATAAYTINIPTNPVPVINGISPAFTNAGGAVFTLTVNGSGFITSSTVYWGTSALTTTYVSATQLTAQVPAADTATVGTMSITVQTPAPGGGASNAWQFEVDSAASGTSGPTITSTSETIAAGSTASYPVTVPSSGTNVSVSCLNLPAGATCSYSSTTNTVTIATSSTTPKGTYQIIVVFTETVANAAFLLPILLLPLGFLRRKSTGRGIWLTACLGLVLLSTAALSIGCGSKPDSTTPSATQQVTSSGAVSLTIQ